LGNSVSDTIILSPSTTSKKHGLAPEERDMKTLLHSGIVVLDKPKGPTSHEVVAWAKGILGLNKAGHSGTLDPSVTGILPVALEDGTKVIKNLLDTGKEYVCLMRLHDDVEKERLLEVLSLFEGKIYQRPPVKSAVKRQVRKREIYSIELLDLIDRFVLVRVDCESGTYIRKLVYDIGMVLGCGANMAELRRTRVGSFSEKDMVTLQELKDSFYYYDIEGEPSKLAGHLYPIERAVGHLRKVYLKDSAIDAVCHGANVAIPGVAKVDKGIRKKEKIALLSLKGELVAIGTSLLDSRGFESKAKGFVVDTQKVVMKEDTYPRYWKSSS